MRFFYGAIALAILCLAPPRPFMGRGSGGEVFYGSGGEVAAPLTIEKKSEAFVAQPIKFEISGDITKSADVSFEWTFSENVRSVSLGAGGRACSFFVFDIAPVALAVKAISPEGKIIAESHFATETRGVDVQIVPVSKTFIPIWNPETHEDEPARGIAVNHKFTFQALISPDIPGDIYYRWRITPACSFDVSEDKFTFWRAETGLSVLDVTIANADNFELGKGSLSVEVVVSQAEINRSSRQRKAWHELQETSQIRAKESADEGHALREKGKWTESLLSYRKSLAAWRTPEVEKAISEIENIVMEIRRERDRASWLRDMEKAHEEERLYRESLEEKNPPPPDRTAEAERLEKEGHEFYRAGKYKEALEFYKKSFEIKNTPQLQTWITRVESGIKAQASIDTANRLIREANALYAIRQYKEALSCYKESLELYPNAEVESFVSHIEAILPQKNLTPPAPSP